MGRATAFPELLIDKKQLPVLHLLGEGAFACVYLVACGKEKYAAKVLRGADSATRELFKQEFLLGKNLCHPAFARFYRFGWTNDGPPFYTMEYLQGDELKKLWPKLDSSSRKLLCYQLFLGLTLLHKKGLVHRDLKPSNLFVVKTGKASFQLKIMDLGLAQSSLPQENREIGGTVDYLAPEVINKEKPDARSDFYSCGIILAELFLGHPPFADQDPAATLARHQEAPLPELPIRPAREKIFWEGLISRLAAKNRDERPSSGEELLELLLEDRPFKRKMKQHREKALDWCRTLCTRPWSAVTLQAAELTAEAPQTILRAKEEMQDQNDLEKKVFSPSLRLSLAGADSNVAYPRFSKEELHDWLASNFTAGREACEILWQKTTGEVSLLELELDFWQKKKILAWYGSGWKWEEIEIRDVPLSPASKKEFLALAETLPSEEKTLASQLSQFLGIFKAEEIQPSGLWPKDGLAMFLENLTTKNFLIAAENGFCYSRPGFREALYLEHKNRPAGHRKIWEYLLKSGQLEIKERAAELEYQAAGAGLWNQAVPLALSAAEAGTVKEDFKTAFWYLSRARRWLQKLARGPERDRLEASVRKAAGNFFGQQGELEKAIAEYEALLKLTQKLKDREAEADALNRLGNYYRQKPEYPKAERYLNKALEIFEQLGLELKLSFTHNNLGATYAHQHRYEEALAHYQQAAEIQRRLDAKRNLASTVTNIGTAHGLADHLKEAARYFREALELNRQLEEKEGIARCLNNLAYILTHRGEFEESQKLLEEARQLNRQIGNQKEEVLNLDTLAQCFWKSGNYRAAVDTAMEGLTLSEKIAYRGLHPPLFASLSAGLKAQGQYAEAQKYFTEGLAAARELKDHAAEVLILAETADLFLRLNRLDEAEKTGREALDLTAGISDASTKARILALLGKLEAQKGSRSEAETKFDEAEKLLAESEHRSDRVEIALQRSEALGFGEAGRKIEELLENVRAFSQEAMSRPQICEKLYLEAALMLDSGQAAEAKTKAAEALHLAYELNEPEKIWRLHHLLGKSWSEEKNYQKVFGELKAAAEVLDGLRENFSSEENLSRYFDDPQKTALLAEIQKVAQVLSQ